MENFGLMFEMKNKDFIWISALQRVSFLVHELKWTIWIIACEGDGDLRVRAGLSFYFPFVNFEHGTYICLCCHHPSGTALMCSLMASPIETKSTALY